MPGAYLTLPSRRPFRTPTPQIPRRSALPEPYLRLASPTTLPSRRELGFIRRNYSLLLFPLSPPPPRSALP